MSERSDLDSAFRQFVCQTSDSPLGIVVARAEGCTLWDIDGREYLDLLAGMGVVNVGHGHPAVRRAIEQQLDRHLHVGVYGEMAQVAQVRLAEQLANVTPGTLSVTYFTNSGTEAVEGALKTARKHTQRSRIACFEGAYHGDTFGSLSVCGNEIYRRPFEPLLADVTRLPFDDIPALDALDATVAAVIVEPVQGEGGVRIPSAEFLPALRQRCDEIGALLIFDEVLTGFGRTGELFASTHWDVVPDIMTLAKALGGGLPLGAFIGKPELMAILSHDPPLAHVTTFGGHPLSCATGLAALEVTIADQLPQRAMRLGERWRSELRELAGGPLREVRGLGLLVALELDSVTHTQRLAARCFERGLILNWTLHRDTVIRLAPPLIIDETELARATAIIATVLAEL